jgi:HlyD family secretion protein
MMNPLKSGRVRVLVIAGAALAVVAATGLVVANTSTAAESRWTTASATTGDVSQTYTATGTVTRKNTETATFAVSGTVNSVKVTVGEQVAAGQVLATIDSRALKLALLQAETTVAQAELNLYNAQHPASASSASKKASSSSSSSTSSSSKSGAGAAPGLTTVTFDLTSLNEAVAAVNLAVVDEAKQCDAIMAWVNESVTGSTPAPTTASQSSEASSSPSASTATEPSASASPTASASPSTQVSAAAASASASASASATQYAAVSDPSEAQIKACATARAQLNTANTALATVMAVINAAANPNDDNSSPGTGSLPSTGSGSSSTKVSKSSVASAKASLLQANQKLQTAKDNLANAELLAPISGTVGTISLTAGNSASSGSITIQGQGDAVVTIEVPLKVRGTLAIGQAVQVAPAGSTKALNGKVTNISLIETSGTAGDSPTYTTTVGVPDSDGLLASGSKASVTVPVKSVAGVVTVPVSAVTPTGTGTATVQVLTSGSDTPKTTEVKTGAVGGGRVEITEGLTVGQVVVIADRTAAIPSNQSNTRRTTSSSSSSSSSTASARASATATTQPSSQATK